MLDAVPSSFVDGSLLDDPQVLRTALQALPARAESIRGGFVDGAHTRERGIVMHRNDAGAEAGATLIVTFRRHVSSAFANLSEAERLFVQTGIALFD